MAKPSKSWPVLVASILCSILVVAPIQQSAASSAMRRLYEDLFSDYNRLILPVGPNQTKVIVTVGLKLAQILDLNLKQQILSTNAVVEQSWHDHSLRWDPSQYEGIELIHVPAENIWIPDIVLFNNADGNYELTLVAKAHAYYNGTVIWKPPTMFRSTCEIDVEFFPFDIQTCYLRFGSWTHAGDEVELRLSGAPNSRIGRTPIEANSGNTVVTTANSGSQRSTKKLADGIDLSQFYKNVEWDIIDGPAYLNEVHRDCCPEPYQDITFKIVIRRKILFYLVNLISPVALMTFMTVSVFYLPSDSNEKITLSISVITSLIVFFLLMLEIIPASSLAVSLFGKYLLFTLSLVSMSSCVSVYVLNIHHRLPAIHSVSPWTRKLFLKTLPKLLFLNQPDPRERSSLNRFRQKKIAQKLLNETDDNASRIYDLSQPMAASLNLIETLHKSYQMNANDDDDKVPSSNSKKANKKKQEFEGQDEEEEDEGRYFRRYVDDFIEKLANEATNKQVSGSCNCGAASSRMASQQPSRVFQSTSNGHQPWTKAASCAPDLPDNGGLLRLQTMQQGSYQPRDLHYAHQNQRHNAFAGHLNDDTLDMTFDYDDQPGTMAAVGDAAGLHGSHATSSHSHHNYRQQSAGGGSARCSVRNLKLSGDDLVLPSPPPPPKETTHFVNSGRLSSCSNRNLSMADNSSDDYSPTNRYNETSCKSVLLNHGYVDRLMSSIQMINNSGGDIDATTSTNTGSTSVSSQVGRPATMRDDLLYHNEQQQLDDRVFLSPVHQPPLRAPLIVGQSSLGAPRPPNTNYQTMQPQKVALCGCPIRPVESSQVAGDTQKNQPQQLQTGLKRPSELLLSLRLPYDKMPAHLRSAIRNVLFIADTIKNEDDENSAIEDWQSISMVIDRLSLWLFLLACTVGSVIILAWAPSLYDTRSPIDDLHIISKHLGEAASQHAVGANHSICDTVV